MPSRRRWLALVLGALCVGGAAVPFSFSGAAASLNENAQTITLALPGPFSGCTFLDAQATPTSDAVLDMILPSAFLTGSNGVLVGEDGPISSAELTSLSPETVRYTIAPKATWSSGLAFTGEDLVDWWNEARTLSSIDSVGYRAIKSLTLSKNKLSVTAVFSTPYADWDLLFRDIEAPGTSTSCAIDNLLTRPSLGPYYVSYATADRIVLRMNPSWTLDPNRFGRVILEDGTDLPSASSDTFADYTLSVNRATVLALSTRPTLSSKIASSSNIEELTFSPRAVATSLLAVREALSVSIERQDLIDTLFGSVTYSPSVAASAIYSQGQADYPGGGGSNPVGQTTTTTTTPPTNPLSDCVSCAVSLLKSAGFVRTKAGWLDDAGKALSVRVGVGPSALDHAVAAVVKADWAHIGIESRFVDESSEIQTAQAAALGSVDVGLFARPTTTTPAYAASSWAGPAYPDSYPSGVRIPGVTALFDQATAIFNPVTASSTWLKLDRTIMTDFWVRPLFTAPTLTIWSTQLSSVANSFTVAGFVDQLPSWTKLPATSTT